jgi:hypothetical protein
MGLDLVDGEIIQTPEKTIKFTNTLKNFVIDGKFLIHIELIYEVSSNKKSQDSETQFLMTLYSN